MNAEKHKKEDDLKSKISSTKSEISSIKTSKEYTKSLDNHLYIGAYSNTIKIPKEHQSTFISLISSILKEQLETLEKEYSEL